MFPGSFLIFCAPHNLRQKNALTTHVNVTHLCRRDHLCSYPECGRTFGYKHLLQRHVAKIHRQQLSTSGEDTDWTTSSQDRGRQGASSALMDIDSITGNAYAMRAHARVQAFTALQCPFPDLPTLSSNTDACLVGSSRCVYVFSRAYDLRRHLRAAHQVEIEREDVEEWVKEQRINKRVLPKSYALDNDKGILKPP